MDPAKCRLIAPFARHLWWMYALAVSSIVVFDIVTHKVDNKFDPSTFVTTVSPFFAAIVGFAVWTPRLKLPWVLWIAGWGMLAIGNALAYFDLPPNVTTPSIRDLFYIAQYPYMTLALVLFIWRREERRDIIATLGAVIMVLGVSAVTFWGTLHDVLVSDGTDLFKIQQVAYVVTQVLFFMAAVRLFLSAGARDFAFWCIMLLAVIIAGSSFIEYEMQNVFTSGGEPDFGSAEFITLRFIPVMMTYIVGGMVALHPSMRYLGKYGNPEPVGYRFRWTRELPITACVFLPLVVTTYHGPSIVLRLVGWSCVALLIVRFFLIFDYVQRVRQELMNATRLPTGVGG